MHISNTVSITALPMAERRRFQLIADAVTNCTPFFVRVLADEDGLPCFGLFDGCADQDGDPFEDLDRLEDYVTGSDDVAAYIARRS